MGRIIYVDPVWRCRNCAYSSVVEFDFCPDCGSEDVLYLSASDVVREYEEEEGDRRVKSEREESD